MRNPYICTCLVYANIEGFQVGDPLSQWYMGVMGVEWGGEGEHLCLPS